MAPEKTEILNWLVEGIPIELRIKRIRSFRITVHPPGDRVVVSAPREMREEKILQSILSRVDWIRSVKKRWEGVVLPKRMEYLDGDRIRFFDSVLEVRNLKSERMRSSIVRGNGVIEIHAPLGASLRFKESLFDRWHRREVLEILPGMLKRWAARMGVRHGPITVRKMKTRWGTCNPGTKKITINSDLVRFPLSALEYVVVHELAHLIEPSHNARFKGIMDLHLPDWRQTKKILQTLPGGSID